MADLDDLGFTSITEMGTDEAIELLRQIRLNRRTPIKQSKPRNTNTSKKQPTPSVDAMTAAKLLEILGGSSE